MRQKIKPAKNVTVWNPTEDRNVKNDGEKVEWSVYWERRLKDASIVLGAGVVFDKIEKQKAAFKKRATSKEKKVK